MPFWRHVLYQEIALFAILGERCWGGTQCGFSWWGWRVGFRRYISIRGVLNNKAHNNLATGESWYLAFFSMFTHTISIEAVMRNHLQRLRGGWLSSPRHLLLFIIYRHLHICTAKTMERVYLDHATASLSQFLQVVVNIQAHGINDKTQNRFILLWK